MNFGYKNMYCVVILNWLRCKHVFNSADMFTKYLDQAALNEAISQFNHRYMDGRSSAAPALIMIGGHDLKCSYWEW